MENFQLKKTFDQDGKEVYNIRVGKVTVGEIALSKYQNDLHIEFAEIKPEYRGKGLYQLALKWILNRNPRCTYISGEVTNKRVYSAIVKTLGLPTKIEGDLSFLPDEAKYKPDGTIESDNAILIGWERGK